VWWWVVVRLIVVKIPSLAGRSVRAFRAGCYAGKGPIREKERVEIDNINSDAEGVGKYGGEIRSSWNQQLKRALGRVSVTGELVKQEVQVRRADGKLFTSVASAAVLGGQPRQLVTSSPHLVRIRYYYDDNSNNSSPQASRGSPLPYPQPSKVQSKVQSKPPSPRPCGRGVCVSCVSGPLGLPSGP
jgi:hypothetical protein